MLEIELELLKLDNLIKIHKESYSSFCFKIEHEKKYYLHHNHFSEYEDCVLLEKHTAKMYYENIKEFKAKKDILKNAGAYI